LDIFNCSAARLPNKAHQQSNCFATPTNLCGSHLEYQYTLTLPLELMFLITRAHLRQVECCHAPTSFGNYLDNYQNHVYSRYLWNPRPKSFAPSVEHWSFPIFMFGPNNLGWRTKLNFVPSGRFFEVCGRWSRVSSLWRLQNRVPIKIIRPPSLRRTSKTLRLQHRLPSPVIKQ